MEGATRSTEAMSVKIFRVIVVLFALALVLLNLRINKAVAARKDFRSIETKIAAEVREQELEDGGEFFMAIQGPMLERELKDKYGWYAAAAKLAPNADKVPDSKIWYPMLGVALCLIAIFRPPVSFLQAYW